MARRTGAKNHIHKYYKLNSNGLWACALDDCSHYMPANVVDQVEGKRSICWQCGEQFRLDEDSMKLARPLCPLCRIKNEGGPTPEQVIEYMAEQARKKREELEQPKSELKDKIINEFPIEELNDK